MMDETIALWIRELSRFNPRLHLMGPAMLEGIEGELQAMLPLLGSIREPEIADLGSGSGLPAIPYKALPPQAKVFVIERSVRKCTFLRHAVETLGLSGVEIISQDPLYADHPGFGAVLARSFSPISTLEKVCTRILRNEGRLYYLFTGKPPALGAGFRLDGTTSNDVQAHRVSLAGFTRLP